MTPYDLDEIPAAIADLRARATAAYRPRGQVLGEAPPGAACVTSRYQ